MFQPHRSLCCRCVGRRWQPRLNEKQGNVPAFKKAVKLLACVQVSSAFVERVFSQLAFIRRAVGDSASRDVLELRTLIRVNNGLMEDYCAKNQIHSSGGLGDSYNSAM